MTPVPADSALALLCVYAEDTFAQALQGGSGAALVSPAPDARLSPAWTVRGTLTGEDALFREGHSIPARTVFYGWLLEGESGEFVTVVRGTGDFTEWLIDGEFEPKPCPHPTAGKVEAGFFDLYQTLLYQPLGGQSMFAPEGIANAVGTGKLTVTGHSLGSALATYLAFDTAALLASRVEAVVFASPRPGDATFGTAFGFRVPHRAYFWEGDLVPRVPFGLGYCQVPGSIELVPPAQLKICRGLTCAHHALGYGAMLNPAILSSFHPTPLDQPFLRCLTVS